MTISVRSGTLTWYELQPRHEYTSIESLKLEFTRATMPVRKTIGQYVLERENAGAPGARQRNAEDSTVNQHLNGLNIGKANVLPRLFGFTVLIVTFSS